MQFDAVFITVIGNVALSFVFVVKTLKKLCFLQSECRKHATSKMELFKTRVQSF